MPSGLRPDARKDKCERYGRYRSGQACLPQRALVEAAGVPFITRSS